MSLILDALKKAEAERQRHSGPTLLELRLTTPRRRWPAWSVLIGILLVANIIVVLGTALRSRPTAEPPAAAAAAAAAAGAAPSPAGAASQVSAAVAVVPTVLTTVPAAATAPAPPSATGIASTAAVERVEDSNPADDVPAVPPPARAVRAAAPPKSEVDLPSLSELGGTVPALRLDLHVYAERPADRYALINMHRAHEGDMLPEGARVVAIDRDGVELDYRGTQFMLRPQ